MIISLFLKTIDDHNRLFLVFIYPIIKYWLSEQRGIKSHVRSDNVKSCF